MTTTGSLPEGARVALVTGGNSGIGRVAATGLAKRGFHVFIACRSAERSRPVLDEIRGAAGSNSIEFLSLDLGDFDSIRKCAETFLSRGAPLHLLVNNAGVAGARGMTRSGFELAFGVNHMGHFLLTQLLSGRIKDSAPARVVTVASTAHYRAAGVDWEAVRKPSASTTAMPEYSVSKLCNVLFSAELGRRLAGTGVSTYSLHPGVVATDIWRSVPWPFRPLIKLAMISPERGAATTLFCATSPDVAHETGCYYDNCRSKRPSAAAQNLALAAELWERSERWVA
jgi:NAD(P)-dependent dehydrogenase (short-subunit alcohol dehydrogenase family)